MNTGSGRRGSVHESLRSTVELETDHRYGSDVVHSSIDGIIISVVKCLAVYSLT